MWPLKLPLVGEFPQSIIAANPLLNEDAIPTTMKNGQVGFTLIELMVTLAVAIILLAAGVPMFSGMAASNRATTQTNTFIAGFKLARSEAVKRGSEVSVCSVADPAVDPPVCGSNTNWRNGLIVFSDNGTVGTIDGGDTRIKVFTNAIAGSVVTTTGAFVRFESQGDVGTTGMTANPACAGSGTCLQLSETEASSGYTRCVHVMQSGQVRLERGACS